MIETLEYLLLKALDEEAKSGVVRERNFILRCNPKNYEKLMNIYCPGQFGWGIHEFNLTFNGIQIRVCSDYDDLNLCMEIGNQISKDEYIFLAKIENYNYIIHIKKLRLYRLVGKTPTLHNFNHSNDIIPWIQYQFRRLKDKVFGVKFIEEGLNPIQKFVNPINGFDYYIYKQEKDIRKVVQVLHHIRHLNEIRVQYRKKIIKDFLPNY